jgi:poly(A) polymerase
VQDLENTDNILTAHPQMGGISNTFICLTEEEQAAASQGELSVEAMKRKEEDFVNKEYKKIYTKNFFIGLEIEKKPSESLNIRRRLPGSFLVTHGSMRVKQLTMHRGWFGQSRIEPVLPQQAVLFGMSVMGQV